MRTRTFCPRSRQCVVRPLGGGGGGGEMAERRWGEMEHFDIGVMKEAGNPFCLIRLPIFLFSFDVEDPFSHGFSLPLSAEANAFRLNLRPCEGSFPNRLRRARWHPSPCVKCESTIVRWWNVTWLREGRETGSRDACLLENVKVYVFYVESVNPEDGVCIHPCRVC